MIRNGVKEMISKKMENMVANSSAIRAMFEEGNRLAKIYGAENVYDFSLGNPDLPAPAAVGEGVIFYACSGNCDKAQQEAFLRYMAPAGKLFPLAEELHAAGSAVAGCGPAFAAIFLESMADGGVACGLPRASAIQYAAQMMLGTAKMVLETGRHPGVLKDSVCSPAGSTIQGVRTLEERGMRAAVLDAVTVAYEKNVELKKASD